MTGDQRRRLASRAAETHGGVLSRRLLHELGIDRHGVRSEVRAGRWTTHGRQTVAMHTGDLSESARRWRAIWEVGHLIAVLDGTSALRAAGLTGYDERTVQVSIPHGSRPPTVRGVTIRSVVERCPGEVVTAGVPRVRTAVAAVRAASWAVSDRQAALVLCLVVQQRLTTGQKLLASLDQLRIRRRRALIARVCADVADGAHSLGELDFARMCRERGLPEPSRQAVRRGPSGRIYLDVAWDDLGLVVEIDGAQHQQGLAPADDQLRQNAVTIGGEMVLRISLVGLRLLETPFMDQVCEAVTVLRARPSAVR